MTENELLENETDPRFATLEADRQSDHGELLDAYNGAILDSEELFDEQIQAVKENELEQTELQNQQTDFAIQQIEQQKAEAEKSYIKEQSAAYADYQKQTAQHGVNAEKIAAQGLGGSGFAESSRVAMYNQYQNRVAVARESVNKAILAYDNAIKEARLQNSAALAEIANQSLVQSLTLALQGFQYKNDLIIQRYQEKRALDSEYHERWKDVYSQINAEKALQKEKRQFDAAAINIPQIIEKDADKLEQETTEEKAVTDDKTENESTSGADKESNQPASIGGHGSVSNTGKTVDVTTVTADGERQTVNRIVWEAIDGTSWYFDPATGKYVRLRIPGEVLSLAGGNVKGSDPTGYTMKTRE